MFDLLRQAEVEIHHLMTLGGWSSMLVTYEQPVVERVWRTWGDFRLMLHRIHPCEPRKALFHPHPWPAAIKVYGSYEMGIGYGAGLEPPALAMTQIVAPGTMYQMLNPDGWHYVCPLDRPSLSLMISGRPWGRQMPSSDRPPQGPLASEVVDEIFRDFANVIPLCSSARRLVWTSDP